MNQHNIEIINQYQKLIDKLYSLFYLFSPSHDDPLGRIRHGGVDVRYYEPDQYYYLEIVWYEMGRLIRPNLNLVN